MRASQRNRLIWNVEQIQRLAETDYSNISEPEFRKALREHAAICMKMLRADEAKFAGRVAPIPPRRVKE